MSREFIQNHGKNGCVAKSLHRVSRPGAPPDAQPAQVQKLSSKDLNNEIQSQDLGLIISLFKSLLKSFCLHKVPNSEHVDELIKWTWACRGARDGWKYILWVHSN